MQNFKVINTFVEELPGDISEINVPRQVFNACYSFVTPKKVQSPKLLIHSNDLAIELGIDTSFLKTNKFMDIMVGNVLPENSKPFAMCYGGHQFGNWANQLGDGRAINIGEVETKDGKMNLQLKGAGPTPYSRTADGYSVLRSSIREFLCSEAMFHLGVPTTRALSLALTGEEVLRDVMYNGNVAYEKGAVVCRVAPCFIRFGNFEILAARQDFETLKKLADYTIKYFFPQIANTEQKYINLFKSVSNTACDMIIDWQRVGFVHGVMNTDNMSILGQTIDYGPYGWMDNFDLDWTPNTTDLPGKRYRFGNQPIIAQWNLLRLANALFPLINDEEALKQILQNFAVSYSEKYQQMMMSKIGLSEKYEKDEELISKLEETLQACEVDMTIFFRELSKVNKSDSEEIILEILRDAFYEWPLSDDKEAQMRNWLLLYQERLSSEKNCHNERKASMDSFNPKYILRNYMAQMVIEAADRGQYEILNELYEVLKKPYDEQSKFNYWFAKRPDWAKEKIGCSMLSCSS